MDGDEGGWRVNSGGRARRALRRCAERVRGRVDGDKSIAPQHNSNKAKIQTFIWIALSIRQEDFFGNINSFC